VGRYVVSRAHLLFLAVIVLVAVVAQVALAGSSGDGPRATESASVKKQIKKLKQRVAALEARASVPAGQVSFFNLGSCPSGWTQLTTARGRYLVGKVAGGTGGGTVGTALSDLENRAVGLHTHGVTDPGHSHFFSIQQGATDASDQTGEFQDTAMVTIFSDIDQTSAALTGITINNAGSVAGTNAPYLQLLVCQKS
jgi:hypothetical protein